jgi:hypothetical protein
VSETDSIVTVSSVGLASTIEYPFAPPAGDEALSAVLVIPRSVAPGLHPPSLVVPSTSPSTKTAES